MKKLTALLLVLFCSQLFAQDSTRISMKEIKAYLKTVNPDSTCIDEYVKRRSQLIVKLAISPVLIAGGTVASAYVGGVTAVALSSAAGVPADGGWAALGYAIGGAGLGLVAGAAVTGADTTATSLTLGNLNKILKTLAEQHMGRESVVGEKLYVRYSKRSEKEMSKEEFISTLMKADAEGTLCDGSMVKQPKIKIGTKMQFKVAKLKDLIREL